MKDESNEQMEEICCSINDALEEIGKQVRQIAAKPNASPQPPDVKVSVAAPSVTVASSPAAVNVMPQQRPTGCKGIIKRSDGTKSEFEFTFTYAK